MGSGERIKSNTHWHLSHAGFHALILFYSIFRLYYNDWNVNNALRKIHAIASRYRFLKAFQFRRAAIFLDFSL